MPRDAGNAGSPLRWLQNARGDLAMARVQLPDEATWEKLCFFAQQAAEKSIKALMLQIGVAFPFTHNIQQLASLLPPEFMDAPIIRQAERLTTYAVLTRYPGEVGAVTEEDYREAVRIAAAVVEWVEDYLLRH